MTEEPTESRSPEAAGRRLSEADQPHSTAAGHEASIPAYRRLLLATDGSLPALAATVHAIELARQSGAELHALHVTAPESHMQVEFADENLDLLHARPVDGIEAARYLATEAGIRIHTHEAHGPIVDSIFQAVRRIGADAIVLGETGTRP